MANTALMPNKKVAIVYLSFYSEPYIPDVVEALKKLDYPKELIEFVIVDNPHPVHGPSVSYLNEHVMPLSNGSIPHTTLLAQTENLGFAGGMNKGVEWAIANNFDYVFFHNSDGSLASHSITALVEAMEADSTIGIAQSLVLLDPDKHLVNSSGNMFHYLGFGYCGDYRVNVNDLHYPNVRDVQYASGAAFMISTKLLKEIGGWDNDFFLYHEDLEFSLRAKIIKRRVVCVLDSVFYHKYEFSKSITKYFWMERNRYGVLLMFYKWPTLLLILPMLVTLELGLWVFALKGGWVSERMKILQYWLKPESWKLWLTKRKKTQAMRQIPDSALLANATGSILFQDASTESPLVTKIAIPVMEAYFKILKLIVKW